MNNGEISVNSEAWAILREQFEILLIYLGRPAVIQQIVILLVALGVAYGLFRLLKALLHVAAHRAVRDRSDAVREAVTERWVPAFDEILFPIIVIVLLGGDLAVDAVQVGLLEEAANFFFVILIYQLVLTLLYVLFTAKNVRQYHRYIFDPLIFVLLVWLALRSFFDLSTLSGVRLVSLFGQPILLGQLLGAGLVLYIFFVLTWAVQGALKAWLPRVQTDTGVVNTVTTITRYLLIFTGILFALTTLGYNLTTLAAVAGGLSLGAGLGLQALVSNFSSGLVLLFEQSIRPGDMVEVDGKLGIVQRLNIRSTVVRTFDNIDIIVPNQNLFTSTVTTHVTPDASRKRVDIRVTVDLEQDPTVVRDVLLETAGRHGLIIEDPAPAAYLLNFGEYGMNFVLWAWVAQLDDRFVTQCDLYYMVWNTFQTHGIRIAYPQSNINLSLRNPEQLAGLAEQFAHPMPPIAEMPPPSANVPADYRRGKPAPAEDPGLVTEASAEDAPEAPSGAGTAAAVGFAAGMMVANAGDGDDDGEGEGEGEGEGGDTDEGGASDGAGDADGGEK